MAVSTPRSIKRSELSAPSSPNFSTNSLGALLSREISGRWGDLGDLAVDEQKRPTEINAGTSEREVWEMVENCSRYSSVISRGFLRCPINLQSLLTQRWGWQRVKNEGGICLAFDRWRLITT